MQFIILGVLNFGSFLYGAKSIVNTTIIFFYLGDKGKTSANSDGGGIHFSGGKVLYYGRAELKTSDHR